MSCPFISKERTADYTTNCGKGNFILAILSKGINVKSIIGIEIYEPYVWQAKFNILVFFLHNPSSAKPEIILLNKDFFKFDFSGVKDKVENGNLLVIGNPPWVTNSKLGALNSLNLPEKTNFKKQNIDSKKEFGVCVDSALFLCRLQSPPEFTCAESDFFSSAISHHFGWMGSKFISNIEASENTASIDGLCPYIWRQGVKHVCASVMELERTENKSYKNKSGEEFILEDDLVFPLFRSSDLKDIVAGASRRYTIITQKAIGQSTDYLRNYPLAFDYLQKNRELFSKRKSSIYNNKPPFPFS